MLRLQHVTSERGQDGNFSSAGATHVDHHRNLTVHVPALLDMSLYMPQGQQARLLVVSEGKAARGVFVGADYLGGASIAAVAPRSRRRIGTNGCTAGQLLHGHRQA